MSNADDEDRMEPKAQPTPLYNSLPLHHPKRPGVPLLWGALFVCLLLSLLALPAYAAPTSRPTKQRPTQAKKPTPQSQPAVKVQQPGLIIKPVRITPQAYLKKIFERYWEWTKRQDPIFATQLGDKRNNHLLPDVSLANQKRQTYRLRSFYARIQSVLKARLSPRDRLNAALFLRMVRGALKERMFNTHLTPITNRTGFHIEFPELADRMQLKTFREYNDYLSRMNLFQRYTRQHIALLRAAQSKGYSLPRVVLKGYQKTITTHIVKDPTKSLMYKPFLKLPRGFSKKQKKQLRETAKDVIKHSVVPAYRAFYEYMTKEYMPKARKTIAASELPNGRAFYRHRVRHYTTLAVTPEQVHQVGLREVARIHREMLAVLKQVKFKGSFAAFLTFLRTSPRFYAKTPQGLLQATAYVLKKMDGQLPKLFGKLPRMSYGIRKIPAYIAPKTTTAYYLPPAGNGRRAGFYYVNTYNLKNRPLYEIEALSFHEAVPGHHLQIALQQELKEVPPFRKFYRAMAFQEGWALYAERLGLEVGFYKDPYSNFGRLTYEMWRACRLVVDTGIHWYGWSRQKAIQYMAQHTALSLLNIRAEVDRYIAWPGQALAYKMGEITIRALRQKAKAALKKRFDLRAFHDYVLAEGALPMDLLRKRVDTWLKQQAKPNTRPTRQRKGK